MIWIISGPTSVGKSTFIMSPRCAEITGLTSETPIVWPRARRRHLLDKGKAAALFYHYNILRPRQLMKKHENISNATDFDQDPEWDYLSGHKAEKKAIVLVASRQTILQRIKQRKVTESPVFKKRAEKPYPAQRWLNLLDQVDLLALYEGWCRELRSHGIPYMLVNSTDETYSIIENEDHLPTIINAEDASEDHLPAAANGSGYTKEQIERILREKKFAYHRVELPFGLHTGGADRSTTRDLILPESLAGKSVLDVGCALGYFCFEAEARGAERVVGVELKEERFRNANLLKDIKGSKVEFMQRDVILDPFDKCFDYVFLLNVIHHLKEPFRAMRHLASITNERLIIEFPTLEDRKFRNTVNIRFPFLYNRLPLIGVSSEPQAGQTFVFTPSAIKRALTDHERLFEKIDILRSPMPGRAIAVCYK